MDIMGWYEEEALEAWKNIFPLTKVSARLGFLPMDNEAWIKTPNPYWHFLMDKQKFHPSTFPRSNKGIPFGASALETILLEPMIS